MGIYEKMRTLVDEGAGPLPWLGRGKRAVKRSAPAKANTANQAVAAMLEASAHRGIEEQHRPNGFYCVANSATTAVADAATQVCTATLNTTDTSVLYFFARDSDCEDFVCTSFKIDGFEIIKGKPVPMAFLLAVLNRIDRTTPLVGRTFNNGTTLEATVQNIKGDPKRFAGIGVAVQEPLCNKDLRSTKPSRAMFGYGAFRNVWGSFFGKPKVRR